MKLIKEIVIIFAIILTSNIANGYYQFEQEGFMEFITRQKPFLLNYDLPNDNNMCPAEFRVQHHIFPRIK